MKKKIIENIYSKVLENKVDLKTYNFFSSKLKSKFISPEIDLTNKLLAGGSAYSSYSTFSTSAAPIPKRLKE